MFTISTLNIVRKRCKSFRQVLSERGDDSLVHSSGVTASVHEHDRAAFAMRSLPVAAGKAGKCPLYAVVKVIARLLHPVMRTASGRACHPLGGTDFEHHRKIGNEPAGRQRVRGLDLRFRQTTAVDLICVRREEETVHQYNYTPIERRVNLVPDDLCPRRHKKQRFGGRGDVLSGVEQDLANGIAEWSSAGLAEREDVEPARAQPVGKKPELRGFTRAL
jgi:hypothetical protein